MRRVLWEVITDDYAKEPTTCPPRGYIEGIHKQENLFSTPLFFEKEQDV